MKIIIDARFWGLENAGLGRYAINIVKGVAKKDRINNYYILLRKKYYDMLLFPENFTKVLCDVDNYSISEQIILPKIISSIKPDLIHYLHFNTPIFCGYPYIVTIHDMIMHKSKGLSSTTLPFYLYWIKRIIYKLVFRVTLMRAKKIIVVSESVKKDLIGYYKLEKEKVAVIYPGVDAPERKKHGDVGDYLLYVGSAYPHKNLERLIDACKNTSTKLTIVTARNVFQKRLMRIIKKKKAESFIKMLPFATDELLFRLYRKSLGFIYPSFFEGFGFQGLEAMRSEVPLLASDIAVFKEIYKDHAMYFNPYSPTDIGVSIQKLKNLSSRERLIITKKASVFVKKYDWEKTALQTVSLYNKMA